jgi:hypothetical protein
MITSNLCCLYVLEKTNMIAKMKKISESVIDYTIFQYEIYRNVDKSQLQELEQFNYPAF